MKTFAVVFLSVLTFSFASFAVDPPRPQPGQIQQQPRVTPISEKTNVDLLKQKYWAQGEASELEVVQNRTYSKAGKFVLGAYLGTFASDPFLSVKGFGGKLGFYFNEYFGMYGLFWKETSNKSSALEAFESYSGSTTNNNPATSFKGGEFVVSPIYGKLSVFGRAIIYYDMTAGLGAGITATENGNYITPYFTIGQKIYLSKYFGLSLDYRLMMYKEDIIEKVQISTKGKYLFSRTNWSDVITVGVDFVFGGR